MTGKASLPMSKSVRRLLKLLWTSPLATTLLAGGCVSPHGGPAFLYWFTPPAAKVTGTGVGSSPEYALRIKHASKDSLHAVEASWLFERYAGPNEIMDDKFCQRLSFETQRVNERIYVVATLAMPDETVRIAYFD
jgi:hypothetical protein